MDASLEGRGRALDPPYAHFVIKQTNTIFNWHIIIILRYIIHLSYLHLGIYMQLVNHELTRKVQLTFVFKNK